MALDYDRMMPLIKKVALSVSRSFPAYVECADTEGELLLWLFQNKAWVQRTIASYPENWESNVVPLMRKAAFEFCNKEKAAAEGYDPSDIYRYSIPKIQTLIVDAFDYEDWQSFGLRGDGQPSARPQANTTGDRVVELIDIKTALLKLNVESYNALVYQYKHGYTMADAAELQGVTLETAKKRAQRALKGLQKELGYKAPTEPPQRRTVRSNAASRAELSNHYEG
jgi:DNA-directed RNA polymerase specialized sigma24 family protein